MRRGVGYVSAVSYEGEAGPGVYGPGADGHGADGTVRPELADVGRLARRATRKLIRTARADLTPTLTSEITAHLGGVPTAPVVEASWPTYEHVNVAAGLGAWLDQPGRTHRIVGIAGARHHELALEDLIRDPAWPHGPRPGNVAMTELPCGPGGRTRACPSRALYLVTNPDGNRAVLLLSAGQDMGPSKLSVEALCADEAAAESVIAEIRALALEHNVFRGEVLSFGADVFGHGESLMRFHERPSLDRDDVVLPPGVLDCVERQVITIGRHQAALVRSGQHLKRGLLLFGPPGTGKTHTIRYLLSITPGVTVLQLTGDTVGLLGQACSVARSLAPAMIVVEDVDLIAEDRDIYDGRGPLLFQLLNEMDGLAEDADITFVLTTNRPDVLEPALAARPGRVDQAVELTIPDTAARRALLNLYRGGLRIEHSDLDQAAAQTDGVTASFLKELLRRAAVIAVAGTTGDGEEVITVTAAHLELALQELMDTRNAMTRSALGAGAGRGVARELADLPDE